MWRLWSRVSIGRLTTSLFFHFLSAVLFCAVLWRIRLSLCIAILTKILGLVVIITISTYIWNQATQSRTAKTSSMTNSYSIYSNNEAVGRIYSRQVCPSPQPSPQIQDALPVMTVVDNSPQESALSVIQGPTGSTEWDRSSYVVPTGDSIIIIRGSVTWDRIGVIRHFPVRHFPVLQIPVTQFDLWTLLLFFFRFILLTVFQFITLVSDFDIVC